MKSAVPYFSQRLDEYNFQSEGFADLESALDWTDRICGLACVKMVLAYFSGHVVPLRQLLDAGLRGQAYRQGVGWIHKGLVELAAAYGVEGRTESVGTDLYLIGDYVRAGEIVVASVGDCLDGRRRGGHLVTITESTGDGFLVHHPSSCKECEWPDFYVSRERLSACLSERGNIIRFSGRQPD